MKRHLSLSAIAAALLFVAALPNAQAATSTATFPVTLTVQPACSITAQPLAFGSTSSLTAAVTGQTTLSVNCTSGTTYTVGLNGGSITGSTVANRLLGGSLVGNTSTVQFELYSDATDSTVWTDTGGANTPGGTGNGSAQPITVYGKVPVQSTPQPDTYQAQVTATVSF